MIETETRDNQSPDADSEHLGSKSGERIFADVTAAEASGMIISGATSGEATTQVATMKKLGTKDGVQFGAGARIGTEVCHRPVLK
ncbi:hypothetical protein PG988_000490 [Apiospora saccharicola]